MSLDGKKNQKRNVGAFKGVQGAYMFVAPLGTAVPKSIDEELDEAFVNAGYVSSDGVKFTDDIETQEHKDINGEVVDSSQSGYTSKMTVKTIETKRAPLAMVYGEGNVVDDAGVIVVHNRGDEADHYAVVLDGLLKGGRRVRRVVHDAQAKEIGEQKLISSELFARESTFLLCKDTETGDYWTDYIESTETEAA